MPLSGKPAKAIRLSQSELDAICMRHERLWLAQPDGMRAILASCDLSGLDFDKRMLIDADLTGAILDGARLDDAVLDRSQARFARFDRASLRGTSLRESDLRAVSMRGADLSLADLFEADLGPGASAGDHTTVSRAPISARPSWSISTPARRSSPTP